MVKKIILILNMSFLIFQANAQQKASDELIKDKSSVVFKDTLFSIATDSFSNDLGEIPMVNNEIFKYFKYIGRDTVVITRTWTGDPHIICEYPREPLINGKVYVIKFCFWHQGRQGRFHKIMGFDLSNGERINYTFKGYVKAE